ncbi:MAG: PH domain-containing protein, partial [Actinomycetota bacterium]
ALIGHVELGETSLRPSSPLTIRRVVVRGIVALGIVLAALGVVAAIFDLGWWLPATAGAAGLLGLVAYARARWRVLGWAVDERHLLVRRGVFARRLNVVPVHKVQDVTIRATFFQRRLGIATVEVDTAGIMLAGRVMAVDLEENQARELADRLAWVAARVALPDGV